MAVRPLDAIHVNIGRPVKVFLPDGRVVSGILNGYDIHMNLVIYDAVFAWPDGTEIYKPRGNVLIPGRTYTIIEFVEDDRR